MTDSRPAGSGAGSGAIRRGGTSLHQETDDGLVLRIEVPDDGPDGTVVITVDGELDMLTAPELRHAVLEHLNPSSTIVLALDGVVFLGTSGLAALIETREHAQKVGATLRLACSERRVLRPLGIAGLHHLFDIRDTVAGALAM